VVLLLVLLLLLLFFMCGGVLSIMSVVGCRRIALVSVVGCRRIALVSVVGCRRIALVPPSRVRRVRIRVSARRGCVLLHIYFKCQHSRHFISQSTLGSHLPEHSCLARTLVPPP